MGQGQPAAGGGPFVPAFGGFMNDQTAQMGFQVGKTALDAGQQYMEQNVHIPELPLSPMVLRAYSQTDKPLRLRRRPKTLLQRHNPLCPPQTPPRPLPLAPQTLVTSATPLNHRRRPGPGLLQLLFPPSARRSQFPGYVHPSHGIRHLHPSLHAPSRSTRRFPPRGHGLDGHYGFRGRGA